MVSSNAQKKIQKNTLLFQYQIKKLDNGKTFHTNISTRFIDTSLSKFVDKYMYLDANNLYGWAMSQKLHVNCFKQKENIHKFNEDFIKNYDEDSNKGYFLEVNVEYTKKLFTFHMDLPFLPERKNRKG